MSVERFHHPGLLTICGHGIAITVLATLLAPLMAVRFLLSPLSELIIRITDALGDALVERLDQ